MLCLMVVLCRVPVSSPHSAYVVTWASSEHPENHYQGDLQPAPRPDSHSGLQDLFCPKLTEKFSVSHP